MRYRALCSKQFNIIRLTKILIYKLALHIFVMAASLLFSKGKGFSNFPPKGTDFFKMKLTEVGILFFCATKTKTKHAIFQASGTCCCCCNLHFCLQFMLLFVAYIFFLHLLELFSDLLHCCHAPFTT